MNTILEIENLTKRFGGLTAVDDLSFGVAEETIHGLIGPNGAGKTTTFNVVSGLDSPTFGTVKLNSEEISKLKMHEIASRGLVRTYQHSTLFFELTVLENAMIGTHVLHRPNIFAAILGLDKEVRIQAESEATKALEFFNLIALKDEIAANLSYGHQRSLAMSIAYASNPKIILFDEPFTGMNPEETKQMMELMRSLKDNGTTILIVEHDMKAIMGLCDSITCMNFGKLIAEGGPNEIRNHPDVIEAYLGTSRYVS